MRFAKEFTSTSPAERLTSLKLGREYALEVVVKPVKSQASSATIISNHGQFDGFTLEQDAYNDGTFLYGFGNDQTWETYGPIQLALGQWNYVVVTVSGDSMKVFVNGRVKQNVDLESQLKNTDAPVFVGNWSVENRPFQGVIKEVRVSSHSLSDGYVENTWHRLAKGLKDSK